MFTNGKWNISNRTRIVFCKDFFGSPLFPPICGDPPDPSGRFRRHKGSGICFSFQSCVTEASDARLWDQTEEASYCRMIKDCTLAPINPMMPHGTSVILTNIYIYIYVYAGFVIQEIIRLCSNNTSKNPFLNLISKGREINGLSTFPNMDQLSINTISILAETTCKMRRHLHRATNRLLTANRKEP